jgi:hypothetical protein
MWALAGLGPAAASLRHRASNQKEKPSLIFQECAQELQGHGAEGSHCSELRAESDVYSSSRGVVVAALRSIMHSIVMLQHMWSLARGLEHSYI